MKWCNRFAAIAAAILILLSGVQIGWARTVRVGIPGHNITQAAFYVARDRGWYREEGLEVQLIMGEEMGGEEMGTGCVGEKPEGGSE